MPSTLVDCETALQHLDDPAWVFIDCRHDLADPDKGLREYGKAHIPGAYFASIDRDLSGPVGTGSKGRHPMPLPGVLARWVAAHGITPRTQVVAYDDAAGQWASRLWWLLRDLGHEHVAVLDGGLTRWKALRGPVRAQHEKARPPAPPAPSLKPGHMPVVDAAAVAQAATTGLRLVDARAPERYRGEVEPVDRRAGHIPGAVSVPFMGNVGPDLRFLPPEQLRARFAAVGITGVAAAPATEPAAAGLAAPPSGATSEGAGGAGESNGGSGAGAGMTASQLARTMTREQRRAAASVRAQPAAPAARPASTPGVLVACYCGSGVTSAHDVLAMEVAGLGTPALYPGSWSEWSYPPAGRPIVAGPADKPPAKA